jgi:uncharacterized MAPEG superfamily protein
MTTPLWCLAIVAVLPYFLAWVGGYLTYAQLGSIDNKNPRQQKTRLEGAAARSVAAQANAWEALPFFTAGVVIAHLAGADPAKAALWAKLFVATRVLHPILYIADLDVLRSLVFVGGLVCVVALIVISA